MSVVWGGGASLQLTLQRFTNRQKLYVALGYISEPNLTPFNSFGDKMFVLKTAACTT